MALSAFEIIAPVLVVFYAIATEQTRPKVYEWCKKNYSLGLVACAAYTYYKRWGAGYQTECEILGMFSCTTHYNYYDVFWLVISGTFVSFIKLSCAIWSLMHPLQSVGVNWLLSGFKSVCMATGLHWYLYKFVPYYNVLQRNMLAPYQLLKIGSYYLGLI